MHPAAPAVKKRYRAHDTHARVTLFYALIAFLTLFIFGLIHVFLEQQTRIGYLEIAGSVAMLFAAGLLRFKGNVALAANLFLLTMLTMIFVMLLTGGAYNTGIFWIFLFPVTAFFLTNKKMGLWWMGALFALIGSTILGSYLGLLSTPYELITFRQLIVSLLVVTIGIYVYQRSREQSTLEVQRNKVASKEERTRAETIIDNIGEGVVAVNNDGRIMLVNKIAADMLGWQVSELNHTVFADTVPVLDVQGEKVSEKEQSSAQAQPPAHTVRQHVTYARKDGSKLLVERIHKPIVVDSNVLGTITTFRDITQENAIDIAKSEFVTIASHQLRTPITAIAWATELLQQSDSDTLNPEQAEQIQEISRSNKRMGALVDAMLTASALELGTIPIRPKKINLATLSDEVTKTQLEKIASDKIIHLEQHYEPVQPVVLFDENIFRSIFSNILANALKYTPSEGTVSIKIHVKESITLTVRDTGIGIPAKQQDKIFTQMFRADNVKREDTDGTGLGLYIVKMMAEYVHGHVSFVSQEDHGSTFTVTLPLNVSPEDTHKGSSSNLETQRTNDYVEAQSVHEVKNTHDNQRVDFSDSLSRRLLDQSRDGMVLTDPNLPDNPLVYVNDSFLKMSGYAREEVLGVNCRFLNNADPNQEGIKLLRVAIAERKPIIVNLSNHRKDGTEFKNELSVSPIFDDNNKLIYFLGIQKDVSDEFNKNAARDTFVSLVAHQLKSYPNAILWSSEVLQDNEKLSSDERTVVEDIRTVSTTMNETIKTLLNITRVQLGTFDSDPQPTIIAETLRGCVKAQQPKIEEKKLNVSVNEEEPGTSINIDPNMLRLITDTLISNAVKYTPDNGTVEVFVKAKNNDRVELRVSDTGIGIPKDEQEHLFTKMYRASNAKEQDGTGLGLYMLKIVAEALEGTIRFESELNEGTTFYVELPADGKRHEGTSRVE